MSESLPPNVTIQEVHALLESEAKLLLLDCRTEHEYQIARIEQATLLPMDQLQERLCELEPFKDGRIVVFCHLGGRSQMVTDWLRQQGFDGAQNMIGGIDEWSRELNPDIPQY